MALSTDKKIYVALGVLVALGAGLWAQQKSATEEQKKHSAAGAAAQLPEIKLAAEDADKITRLDVTNGAKGEVVLEKKDDKWRVTKPVDFPANQQNVKLALDNLKDLKVKDVIDPGASQYASYDLDGEKSVHVVATKDGAPAIDLYFGKSGSRGQMVRIGGKDGVYVAGGWSSYLFAREPKAWRDGKMIEFDDANVVAATIQNDNGAFSFWKNGDAWSGTFKGAKIDDFDDAKVKDFVRAFKALNAEDYGDGKAEADTGLDKPVAKLSFTLKDGAGEKQLVVGKVATGTSRYAKLPTSETVYVVSGWASEWATANVGKFQKTGDAGAPKAAPAKK